MVQWMKIKCVTLRSARSYPPRLLLLLLGFSHQNGAQQRTTATEKEREAEREIPRETQRERNSWSDKKNRGNSYSITINKFTRLHVSIPMCVLQQIAQTPPLKKNKGVKKKDP